jgi:predicted HTH domain antitoxin
MFPRDGPWLQSLPYHDQSTPVCSNRAISRTNLKCSPILPEPEGSGNSDGKVCLFLTRCGKISLSRRVRIASRESYLSSQTGKISLSRRVRIASRESYLSSQTGKISLSRRVRIASRESYFPSRTFPENPRISRSRRGGSWVRLGAR